MADNKSSEGKLTTRECYRCEHRQTFTDEQFKFTDGLSCEKCGGPTTATITRPGEKPSMTIRPRKEDGPRKRSVGQLKIDVDVSEALKGLKAVQREARRATAALKELEKQQLRNSLTPNGPTLINDENAKRLFDNMKIANQPILSIILEDEEATPKVFYDGEEITDKTRINFQWETKTAHHNGKTILNVEHYEFDENGIPYATGIAIHK